MSNSDIFSQIEVPSSLNSISSSIAKIMVGLKNKLTANNKKNVSIVNAVNKSSHAFVTDNFSYISYVKINGLGLDPTPDMIENMQHNLNQHLREYLKSGHHFQYCFASFQDNVIGQLQAVQRGRDESAERLGLSSTENDQAQIKHIKDNTFFEESLIILISPPVGTILNTGITDLEIKQPSIPLSSKFKDSLSQGKGDALLTPHQIFVDSFMQFCSHKEVMLDASLLDHDEALSAIMAFTDSKTAKTSNAQKIDPNFNVTTEMLRPDLELFDAFFAKDFDAALFKEKPELHKNSPSITRIGDRFYISIIMDGYSSEFMSFNALHKKLSQKRIPYLCKTSVGGDPLRGLNLQYTASKLGGIGNQREFVKLYGSLVDYSSDEAPIYIQQVFTTWVDGEENLKQLRVQAEELQRSLIAWTQREANKCHIDNITPRETLISVMPSCIRSTATKIPLPLNDVSNRLPIFRPSFPWSEDGDFITTSRDGKVMPISFSNGRTAKITYITGSMGTGKSVLLSWARDNLVFHRDSKSLGYQVNLDVDNSIKIDTELYGVESELIRDKVIHLPISNAPHSKRSKHLNILDTPPGMRRLPSSIKAQIVSTIADRLTGVSGQDIKNVDAMVHDLLDRTYLYFAQPGTAKRIFLDEIPSLKMKLRDLGFAFLPNETYQGIVEEPSYIGWDIVDFLMLNKEVDFAMKVQTKCVPLLTDVLSQANKSEWQQANQIVDSVEPRGKLVADGLKSMIKTYPFISHESTYSIWNKHIITFELGKVIDKSSNPASVYRSRFWFNLVCIYVKAILMLSIEDIEEYFDVINSETQNRSFDADNVSSAIREYHNQKIRDVATAIKRGCFDEWHRFIGDEGLGAGPAELTISSWVNEIRRSGVELCFASPLPIHGRMFKDIASMVVILGFNAEGALKQCKEVFELSEYETQNYVRPLRLQPQKGINAYLILNNVNEISNINEFRHVVYFPIPPNFIWRCANRNFEKVLRELVIDKFGFKKAMVLLSGALPSAGSSKELDRIRLSMQNNGAFDDIEPTEDGDEKIDTMLAEAIFEKIVRDEDYIFKEGKKLIYLNE